MSNQPDLLILKMQEGSEMAFSRVYERYNEALRGIIFAVVKDDAVAEEVLQDVFMKIWNNSSSYDVKQGRFFTWALNISRNAAIDHLRSKAHKNNLKNLSRDYFVHIPEDATDEMEVQTDSLGIMKWVNKLKPTCIKIIDLIFFKGFTFKDGATELNIPEGTLKTRHRKCVNELRNVMGE
ncbi:RNA polymerase subunit sigma-70 [Nonlabens arenilitoris]|uniref:RNA polymerase subunit sigma-70 n=1 Tax=Nonlabens arenilitoris TaxID=1217969 RepID=A0A2S7UBY4_9FLAO|nr:RNA polymerase sigma factor [Nonlabens arenilitoris]PQJ32446.1 RNA polymerase subunit sigma-70 [Nonlabens arenilitoris]